MKNEKKEEPKKNTIVINTVPKIPYNKDKQPIVINQGLPGLGHYIRREVV